MKLSRKTFIRTIGLTTVGMISVLGLSACANDSTLAASPSMCAYTIGDGSKDSDRNIDKVLLPGDDASDYDGDKKDARYFPCGSRNYVVSSDSGDADGKVLLTARTKDQTPVSISVSVYWMVNQNRDVLKQFIAFCEKYSCAKGDADSGANNFATEGWNGMLKENFHGVLQTLAEAAFVNIDDSVWKTGDLTQRQIAADAMSKAFAAEMRKRTGYTSDLFCGSTSASKDGKFDCTDVRITVDNVVAANADLQNAATKAKAQQSETDLANQNAQTRIDSTNRLYGPDLAAKVRACQDLGEQCKFVIGPDGAIINVP